MCVFQPVKTYARLAFQAGALDAQAYALIHAIKGYGRGEQRRIDGHRSPNIRRGLKKVEPVRITPGQAATLKTHPDTPQGRRDKLLMCLLLDHGLRVGEVASLNVEDFIAEEDCLRFFRSKVGKEQTHRLSDSTRQALADCAAHSELPESGRLLRHSLKNGALGKAGMTTRGITLRVRILGQERGTPGLERPRLPACLGHQRGSQRHRPIRTCRKRAAGAHWPCHAVMWTNRRLRMRGLKQEGNLIWRKISFRHPNSSRHYPA